MERKGGGARRGPFAGKREPFATRLTSDTMERLTKAAERDGLSISQKAEELLVRALKAEDLFERALRPTLDAFEEAVKLTIIALGENKGSEREQMLEVTRSALQGVAATLPTSGAADQPKKQSGTRKTEKRTGLRVLDVD